MNLNNDDITVNTYKVEEKGTKNKLELTKMSKQIEHEGKQITVSCYYGTDTELNITF